MKNKSIPANPMEIAKIRMLFDVPTSAKKILESGCADTLCYIIPDGTFYIEKMNNTGDFNKDYKITKRLLVDKNSHVRRFCILDEIDIYPTNFIGTTTRERKWNDI